MRIAICKTHDIMEAVGMGKRSLC